MFRLAIQVQPRASRNAIVGWHGEALKVALTAPPVEGAANAALIEFLSSALHLKRRQLRIVSGDTSRHKLIEIHAEPSTIDQYLPAGRPAPAAERPTAGRA